MTDEPEKKNIQRLVQPTIAGIAILAIAVHLVLRYGLGYTGMPANLPLWIAFVLGGIPLVIGLLGDLVHGRFGSDLLAGISIVTSVILGEYLAGTLVILMLSGGETLEAYAVRSASSVLKALAARMPSTAHRRAAGELVDVAIEDIAVGDELVVLPHDICPIDGTVIEGKGTMDESYLTGEPYVISKTPGSEVISGALNGESALVIRADKLAQDSRYSRIMEVMKASEEERPPIRRMADKLGAFYTPVAVALAVIAWLVSGDPVRFLAVLVVATPCPLLIGIPVAIIGSISLAAKRAIIIRDPSVLETIDTCRAVIFDKTGTLTYGRPELTGQFPAEGIDPEYTLQLVGSMEQYSKHPLAEAIVRAAQEAGRPRLEVNSISEKPGEGMTAMIDGHEIKITSRKKLAHTHPEDAANLPPLAGGLECVILVDGNYAATYQFRDAPRAESREFVKHLSKKHHIEYVMLLSGDRESEVAYLAEKVGVTNVLANKSPEEKLEIVREETAKRRTVYVGDGINDAPALTASTVGIAFGQRSDVTARAAGAVIMDSALRKVDELLHISRRMRHIALQSAIGGMALSIIGMIIAAMGYLPPVAGAIAQEVIDVLAVLNALRVALPPKALTDY